MGHRGQLQCLRAQEPSKSLGIGPAARMSRSGQWGGEPELLMLSKALQRPIEVRPVCGVRSLFVFVVSLSISWERCHLKGEESYGSASWKPGVHVDARVDAGADLRRRDEDAHDSRALPWLWPLLGHGARGLMRGAPAMNWSAARDGLNSCSKLCMACVAAIRKAI